MGQSTLATTSTIPPGLRLGPYHPPGLQGERSPSRGAEAAPHSYTTQGRAALQAFEEDFLCATTSRLRQRK